MNWNVALETIWGRIRQERQLTSDIFMNVVFEVCPGLNESHIIAWERTLKMQCWERDVCDFMWVYWKWARENRTDWRQHIDRMWPKVQNAISTQYITEKFIDMGF